MDESLKKIIMLCKQGEESAFENLYHKYYSVIYNYALSICKNHVDAEEATQETFLMIHKYIHELNDINAFSSWVRRIVYTQCIYIFRKNKVSYLDPNVLSQSNIIEQRKDLDVKKNIDNVFEKEELTKILLTLKKEYQEVLYYVYIKQMKYEEVAKILNIPEGTVKSRTLRAKALLAKKIKIYEKEENRKMTFHHQGFYFTGFLLFPLLKMKDYAKKLMTPKAVKVMSATSIVTLTTVGSISVVSKIKKIDQPVTQQIVENDNKSTIAFQPTIYRGEWIKDTKTAYFKCLQYAYTNMTTQETIKKDSEIKAVYQSLKNTNDQFYHLLLQDLENNIYE